MVRLVFRPYTQISRSICTSEPLRASTRVSPGFALFRHSSPSFGSQHLCSNSNLSPKIRIGRWCLFQMKDSHLSSPNEHLLSLRVRVLHSNTRIYVRLLGPCFKTGRLQPFRPHHQTTVPEGRNAWFCSSIQTILFVESIQLRGAYLPNDVSKTDHIDANSSKHTDTQLAPYDKCAKTTLVAICFLLAISGTLSLSFQSSLHLSLTVLVRYRSLAII
jgi:hypothetical protein